MTNEEKIAELINIRDNFNYSLAPREVFDDAIKALEQEPCEDAVSRDAVLDLVADYDLSMGQVVKGVHALPFVIPARPNAHNNNEDYAECDQFVCSNCGIELQDWHRVERDEDDGEVSYHEYTFKFCPNCGAEMESEDDE